MGIEIERKFLVVNDSWREQADEGTAYKQGYLIGSNQVSVRIRIEGKLAFINIKSATLGVCRQEYQYPIPLDEANMILNDLCEKPLIEKTRFKLPQDGFVWEIDVFSGENDGLIVAEIELNSENDSYPKPDWLGMEVSDDPRYYNVNLVSHPFNTWNRKH